MSRGKGYSRQSIFDNFCVANQLTSNAKGLGPQEIEGYSKGVSNQWREAFEKSTKAKSGQRRGCGKNFDASTAIWSPPGE